MKINAAWKLIILVIGIPLTAIMTFSILSSKTKPECGISQGQTVVKWKDMYWFPCKYWWNGFCIWPPQRKHRTYKVTVKEGVPLRNEKGAVILIAGGKIRDWQVYDATAWNELQNDSRRRDRYQNYEPIAENEYVVDVQTRYWLFHNVEANLRLCTQKP
jgi:hypothetical protein